ncbi:hypothetical protein [uncultured Maribacter sp.]|uniref:hypothetical protein n=1 Tax=uncultured Maribacter sp. TaxID=431308 RepID=UPI0030DD9295
MKSRPLRLVVLLFFIFITSTTLFAQDKKLKVHALSFGAGIATADTNHTNRGLGINLDFSAIVNDHIISLYLNSGLNLTDIGANEDFYEFNVTYGRIWSFDTKLVLEGHVGVGLFVYNVERGPNPFFVNIPDNTIGFPLRAKLLYYPIGSFALGINPNANFNSIADTYSFNVVFQYNFN